jgi:hypothetical protein
MQKGARHWRSQWQRRRKGFSQCPDDGGSTFAGQSAYSGSASATPVNAKLQKKWTIAPSLANAGHTSAGKATTPWERLKIESRFGQARFSQKAGNPCPTSAHYRRLTSSFFVMGIDRCHSLDQKKPLAMPCLSYDHYAS